MYIMDAIRIISLNVLYEPKIAESSPYHFFRRWPAIQNTIRQADVVNLQEVHESFMPAVEQFATSAGYLIAECLYHKLRRMHLVTLVKSSLGLASSASYGAVGTFSKMLSVTVGRYTIFNVHLPLDINVVGERMVATKAFLTIASETVGAVLVGDWNTLPGRGDIAQLEFARNLRGKLITWAFGDGVPRSTYWGFPHENESIQGYNEPTILDHAYAGPDIDVILAECRHEFIEVDGVRMGISDHMPCHVYVR